MCESEAYLNAFEHPDPAISFLTSDSLDAHNKINNVFRDEMYGASLSGNRGGEEIWLGFISSYRLHSS